KHSAVTNTFSGLKSWCTTRAAHSEAELRYAPLMPESLPRPARALAQRFFDHYVELHPEESTTLGLALGAERLRDHSAQALAEEARWYAVMGAELASLEPTDLSQDQQLDVFCMQRLVDFEIS